MNEQKAHDQSAATAEWSSRCLLAAFAHLGRPRSMLDIGCGPGHLVDVAARLGVDAAGVDLLAPYAPTPGGGRTSPIDLRRPHQFGRLYQMVLCWEVAEHVPARNARDLVATIVSAVAGDGTLLFTAARPGQGGAGHVNEQLPGYWRSLFESAGFRYIEADTEAVRKTWLVVCGPAFWYPQNLQVFRR